MQTFRDTAANLWHISLPFGEILRIKQESEGKFDLLEPTTKVGDHSLAVSLDTDLILFWELLWYLVEPQAVSKSIDAVSFGQAMAGECLIDAQAKFFKEWSAFFHALQRPVEAMTLEKISATKLLAVKKLKAKLPELETSFRRMDPMIDQVLNKSFGNLEQTLASTLQDLPGGN